MSLLAGDSGSQLKLELRHQEDYSAGNFFPRNPRAVRMSDFRNLLGMFLQLVALTFLPILIIWQLNFGFNVLWMPGLTILGLIVFVIGHKLRDQLP